MDKDTRISIDLLKTAFNSSLHTGLSRLPQKLISETDTRNRLCALYELFVEDNNNYCDMDVETYNNICKVSRWLYYSNKSGLILMGGLGNGKSTMLRAINKVFDKGSVMSDAQTIYDYYKTSQGNMLVYDEKLLLIDDLGIEPETCRIYGDEYHPLSSILMHRYNRRLTTIIATNLDMPTITVRYGDRVADRMYETYEVIPYRRSSFRRQ